MEPELRHLDVCSHRLRQLWDPPKEKEERKTGKCDDGARDRGGGATGRGDGARKLPGAAEPQAALASTKKKKKKERGAPSD